MTRALALLGVPPADRPMAEWHVSPLVDALAYHFSWALVLLPIAFAGDRPLRDWFLIWALSNVLGTVHRFFSLPYVYLDGQVFRQHPGRFLLAPVVMILGLLAMPGLNGWTVPAMYFGPQAMAAFLAVLAVGVQWWWADRGGYEWSTSAIRALAVLALLIFLPPWLRLVGDASWFAPAIAAACAAVSIGLAWERRDTGISAAIAPAMVAGLGLVGLGLHLRGLGYAIPGQDASFKPVLAVFYALMFTWNIWHVYMQKYGILRLYSAKSTVPMDERVPGWIDRLFVFGWVPLYFVWFGEYAQNTLRAHTSGARMLAMPLARFMETLFPILVGPTVALVVVAVVLFFVSEWRASGLRSLPRVSMALGLVGLGFSFLVLDPLKAYVAFGFAHAVEYMVFVWAFQRRRYAAPLGHDPWLGRVLRWPLLAYGGALLVCCSTAFWFDYADAMGWVDKPFRFLGASAGNWVFWVTLWSSIAHFWYDGFLWKMRLPAVREMI